MGFGPLCSSLAGQSGHQPFESHHRRRPLSGRGSPPVQRPVPRPIAEMAPFAQDTYPHALLARDLGSQVNLATSQAECAQLVQPLLDRGSLIPVMPLAKVEGGPHVSDAPITRVRQNVQMFSSHCSVYKSRWGASTPRLPLLLAQQDTGLKGTTAPKVLEGARLRSSSPRRSGPCQSREQMTMGTGTVPTTIFVQNRSRLCSKPQGVAPVQDPQRVLQQNADLPTLRPGDVATLTSPGPETDSLPERPQTPADSPHGTKGSRQGALDRTP